MPELSPEAKSKFDRWHLRQRELGACRCKECRDALPVKPTQAPATLTFKPFEELLEQRPGRVYFMPAGRSIAEGDEFPTGTQLVDLEVGPPPPEPEEVARVRRDKDRALASKLCLEERQRIATAKELVTGAVPISHLIEQAKAAHAERAVNALDIWEAKKKLAMGGGAYERDPAKLHEIEQRLDRRDMELAGERTCLNNLVLEAEARERKARLTYEQARANLEREFGSEVVGRSIAALEKILTFRKDFDALAEYAEEAQEEIETMRNSCAELDDNVSLIRGKLGRMKEQLDD